MPPVGDLSGPVQHLNADWNSIVANDEIDASRLAATGIEKGRVLVADGQGGVEFNPMSTFDFNHEDLVESLTDKDKEELLDIIQRHRKTVEGIDNLMIDLLAGAELCSKVILETLNKAKAKTLQLINYALSVLMDDMGAIDALKKEESEKSKSVEEVLNALIGGSASMSNRTLALPSFGAGKPQFFGIPLDPMPQETVGVTAGDPMPAQTTTVFQDNNTRKESNSLAVNVDFSGGSSGGQ